MEKIMARKDAVVKQNVGGIEMLFKSYGITTFKGQGTMLAPNRILVKNGGPDSQEVNAANVIIATGSSIARLPIPGVDLDGVIDSDRILSLKHIPKSIVIVGGGIIGVEWAGILAPLGTKVTIVEALPTILAPVDEELMKRFLVTLKKMGVEVYTNAKVEGIEQNSAAQDESQRLTVRYSLIRASGGNAEGEAKSTNAELVMMAVGRWPYTDGLGLQDIGVQMNRRAVISNNRMGTNVAGVYAIGDVTQRIMLAHVASHEGEVAASNIMGHSRLMNYRAVPSCLYTNPEIASVGPTEQELKASGIPYRIGKFPFTALGRAVTLGDTTGLVKLLVSEEKGEILAGHIMGPDATDLIAELVLAVRQRVTAEELAETIHAHPTLPEAIQEAALSAVPGASAIHFKKSNL
jgi:dihydrolipoamide dehydrogenase